MKVILLPVLGELTGGSNIGGIEISCTICYKVIELLLSDIFALLIACSIDLSVGLEASYDTRILLYISNKIHIKSWPSFMTDLLQDLF